jgi:hypothetical protein
VSGYVCHRESDDYRARDNQGLSPSVQGTGQRNMCLQTRRPDLLYQCKLVEKQRRNLKKNIVHHGHWSTSKQELIKKFRKPFMTFIESIDFDLL